jgi:hypothetical protein
LAVDCAKQRQQSFREAAPMWDFNLKDALAQLRQTAPFLMFRVAAYFGVTLAMVLATWLGAALGWIVGAFGGAAFQASASVWGGIFGFGVAWGAFIFLRDRLLQLVNAAHVAVMMDVAEDRYVPNDFGQIAQGWATVVDRFGKSQSLFGLDLLLKNVIGTVPGLVENPLGLVPVPHIGKAPAVAQFTLRAAGSQHHEIILAHLIRNETKNPFHDAQDALALYARNAAPLLRVSVPLTVIGWAVAFLVFLVMLIPAAFVVWIVLGTWSLGGIAFAATFAWAFKAALIDPVALSLMLQVFFRETKGQSPDPAWAEKLDGATVKFKTLGQRAMMWASGHAARVSRWEESA